MREGQRAGPALGGRAVDILVCLSSVCNQNPLLVFARINFCAPAAIGDHKKNIQFCARVFSTTIWIPINLMKPYHNTRFILWLGFIRLIGIQIIVENTRAQKIE